MKGIVTRRPAALAALLVVAAGALAACNVSPEAARTRGGGPGADIGNRGPEVEIHGPTNPACEVPAIGRSARAEATAQSTKSGGK